MDWHDIKLNGNDALHRALAELEQRMAAVEQRTDGVEKRLDTVEYVVSEELVAQSFDCGRGSATPIRSGCDDDQGARDVQRV